MVVPIVIVVAGLLMLWAEVRMPGRKWPEVKGWWARAALFNGLQAGVVFFMGQVWHGAGETFHLWNVDAAGPIGGALIG